MATNYGEFIAGETVNFEVDAANFGTITNLIVEVYQNDTVIVKFSYVVTTGYLALSKSGDKYSGTIPATTTDDMFGMYGIELTAVGASSTQKGKQDKFIYIVKEAT